MVGLYLERYSFTEFTVDVAERRLSCRGVAVPLPPIAFDVLLMLVRHSGQLVTKRDLLRCVWQDTFVEDGILTVYISLIRKALADTGRPPRYVQTVTRFGYRFIAPVVRSGPRVCAPRVSSGPANPHVERGREHLLNGSCFALRHAVEAFQSAIRVDSQDAAAHAGFAIARCAQAQNLAAHPQRAYADATGAVLRALALDQRDSHVQVALGTVLLFREWDAHGAEGAARRALEDDVENVNAYVLYGNLLEAHGDIDRALDMKMRALAFAPGSPVVLTQIARSFWRKRDYGMTIEWTQRALAQDPTHPAARGCLAYALWKIRRYDAVTAELVTQAESFGIARETLIRASAGSESGPDAERWPSPFTRVVMAHLPTPAGGPSAVNAALSCGERGETDAAFRHLDRVMARRDPCLVHLAVDPEWDTLRDDERFTEKLKYINLGA
jgi:DNA-binding winged helix-turn-helix (wHTH) protein/cytochrome c-type biogenesis protein CcmH/NrfG